ncbi:Hypothetical Protein FCC1311_042572 [Hondaea fermentalgiana]|uniref:Uncharacterized protein n=1 Tax=Hondaea fermentalgiana TaxID=2315210 RepID=A0A2R5GJJ7_9STRA|nr:Hypothetical Protein FCC1311_042572 [Hondaea fermentalgiana]|eukprot:GBG28034.1 Hypothetical Protein FCC1311_042572 [Hondaea fermentalgiana]
MYNAVTCSNDEVTSDNDNDNNPGIYTPDVSSMLSISLGVWIAIVVVIVLLWACTFAVCYYCIQILEKKEAGLPVNQRTMNTTAKAVMFSATLCMGCMGLAGAFFLYNHQIEQAWQRNAMQNAVVAVTPVDEKV